MHLSQQAKDQESNSLLFNVSPSYMDQLADLSDRSVSSKCVRFERDCRYELREYLWMTVTTRFAMINRIFSHTIHQHPTKHQQPSQHHDSTSSSSSPKSVFISTESSLTPHSQQTRKNCQAEKGRFKVLATAALLTLVQDVL
ncbi:hypothetical protein BLNAU_7007 [Blattamonas nauphoetae]|uniref:Uncharacterized protein n=1 Tax=Blattamonas nauphoetae TaxID=2049346 RepID=A0ABQ9Y2V7_9EUKA|nr:hypothetical protein BLNAU_7007 [Blattamonas nauphoetae]